MIFADLLSTFLCYFSLRRAGGFAAWVAAAAAAGSPSGTIWVRSWDGLAILVGLSRGDLSPGQFNFFYERTVRSLTYSAPFAAPLAYTGLGFLLWSIAWWIQNPSEWAHWVLFFTLGGFAGNFVFSLADHAENGFFDRIEWVPVAASALAVGFLTSSILSRQPRDFLRLCSLVLLLEGAIGVWGFYLHAERNLAGPSVHLFKNLIYGAPPMAPLLFPNLAALGLIALWQLARLTPANASS